MGIYYCAADENTKEMFDSPKNFSIKFPGIFHPTNPFSNMVVMMNSMGYNFEIFNDCGHHGPYAVDAEYKDITDEVYEKYINFFPWAKHEIYEPIENKPAESHEKT